MTRWIRAAGITLALAVVLVSSAAPVSSGASDKESALSYFQCPGAPFVFPAEYVHASYSTLPNWTHVGIDMTGLTADFNLARNPPVCSVGSGIWEVGVPGVAPVYAAYDGVVWGSHIVNGTWIGLYIKHENVPVNGHIEPVICTYYEHMGNYNTGQSTIFPQFRSWGAPVQKGEQIGWIGNQSGTGSTFAHLHFGVRPSLYNGGCNPGSNPSPLDPYWWTDPSPYLGFNVNWGNGAPQYCYHMDCPPVGQCCCGTRFTSSGESYTAETVPTETLPLTGPFALLPTLPLTLTPEPALTPATPSPTAGLVSIWQPVAQVNTTPPTSAHYTLARSILGTGGGLRTSTHFVMQGTSSQTTGVDWRQSTDYVLRSGYWTWEFAAHHTIYLPIVLRHS